MDESLNQTKNNNTHPKIGLKLFRLDGYFFIITTYKHLKVKSTITRSIKCFVPAISTSKNLFKEIQIVISNAPGKSTSFEQMFVG